MLYIKEDLRDLALAIIDQKSTLDDIKAFTDVLAINNAINSFNPNNVRTVINAQQLDERIREEYPELEWLQNAVNVFPVTNVSFNNRKPNVTYAEVERLRFDEFGVYVSVLLKHGKIGLAKDFINKIEE